MRTRSAARLTRLRVRPPSFPHPICSERDHMDFLGNTWVMVGMGVALVALIGLMIFLRMKPKDED